jgi:hypothetical protein
VPQRSGIQALSALFAGLQMQSEKNYFDFMRICTSPGGFKRRAMISFIAEEQEMQAHDPAGSRSAAGTASRRAGTIFNVPLIRRGEWQCTVIPRAQLCDYYL